VLALAMRHPELVSCLVLASGFYLPRLLSAAAAAPFTKEELEEDVGDLDANLETKYEAALRVG